MEYLELLLDSVSEHIEDYGVLVCVLSLLPVSYRYVFVRNLLVYWDFLVDGDLLGGVPPSWYDLCWC